MNAIANLPSISAVYAFAQPVPEHRVPVVCSVGAEFSESTPVPGAGEEDWEPPNEWRWGENPELLWYRERTLALLKRYMRLSVEVGRLPSLLGREFFRTQVTSYHIATFEDVVIFVHDMERSLEKLDWFSRNLIAKMVLLEYTQDETAALLGCWRRTVGRRFPEALDQLSEILLEGGLLKEMPVPEPPAEREEPVEKICQEAEVGEFPLTDSL